MKYEIPIYRTESKDVQVFADSPHEALKMVLASNPGFHADSVALVTQDPDEPEEEIHSETYEAVATCEDCSEPILTGDKYFRWGGEDEEHATCEGCGGYDHNHQPEIA